MVKALNIFHFTTPKNTLTINNLNKEKCGSKNSTDHSVIKIQHLLGCYKIFTNTKLQDTEYGVSMLLQNVDNYVPVNTVLTPQNTGIYINNTMRNSNLMLLNHFKFPVTKTYEEMKMS